MLKAYPLLTLPLLLAQPLAATSKADLVPLPYELASSQSEGQNASTFQPFTGSVLGSKVRMRLQPNLDGYVVRETAKGELFIVVGESSDYFAISPPKEIKGYVFRTYVLDGEVEAERVNVRLYPDIDAPVVGQLSMGDKVDYAVSDINSKWLEIALPQTTRFYIAKEYVERKGPPELLAAVEKMRQEASHALSSAILFAQSEIQKPFEEIDIDRIHAQLERLTRDYAGMEHVVVQAHDTDALMEDIYVQKKISFLEEKANQKSQTSSLSQDHLERLAKLGIDLKPVVEKPAAEIANAASKTLGLSLASNEIATDKMLLWQPLEESLYHLWAVANGEKSIDEFYAEEQQTAATLTGVVEPYTRPVKNRPGDFILRRDNMPVAFLYSTRINLEKLVGQRITLMGSPRPNHNFAFPAYFVISIE